MFKIFKNGSAQSACSSCFRKPTPLTSTPPSEAKLPRLASPARRGASNPEHFHFFHYLMCYTDIIMVFVINYKRRKDNKILILHVSIEYRTDIRFCYYLLLLLFYSYEVVQQGQGCLCGKFRLPFFLHWHESAPKLSQLHSNVF